MEPLQTITAILFGSKWSCLFSRVLLQDALSGVPLLKLRVCVKDITAFMTRRNKEMVEMSEKVLKKLKSEVDEKGFKLQFSSTRSRPKGDARWAASRREEEELVEMAER